jgi:hypothetical protein
LYVSANELYRGIGKACAERTQKLSIGPVLEQAGSGIGDAIDGPTNATKVLDKAHTSMLSRNQKVVCGNFGVIEQHESK